MFLDFSDFILFIFILIFLFTLYFILNSIYSNKNNQIERFINYRIMNK